MTVTKCSAWILARDSARITRRRRKDTRNIPSSGWTLLLAIAIFFFPANGLTGPVTSSEGLETQLPQSHFLNQREEEKSTESYSTRALDSTFDIDTNNFSYSELDTSTTESYDFISKSLEIGSKANVDVTKVDINNKAYENKTRFDIEIKNLSAISVEGAKYGNKNSQNIGKENRSDGKEKKLPGNTVIDDIIRNSSKEDEQDEISQKRKVKANKEVDLEGDRTFAVLSGGDVKILQTDNGKALLLLTDDDDGELENFLDNYMGNMNKASSGSNNETAAEEGTGSTNVSKTNTQIEFFDGEEEKMQGDMPFERLPRLELVSNEVLSELNVKQVLECDLPMNATFSYWVKDGQKLPLVFDGPGVRARLILTKAGHAVISKVIKADDGSWVCNGFDSLGTRYAADPVHLIVLEMPYNSTLEIGGQKVRGDGEIAMVKEGVDLRAVCAIKGGRPRPKLTWIARKDARSFRNPHGNYEEKELDVENEETTEGLISILTITSGRLSHNSTISCVTSHPSLTRSMFSTVRILIEYAPRFAISRYPGFGIPLTEGMEVSLRCEIDSFPLSKPTWLRGDDPPPVPQYDDGYLNFTSLKQEDSGWYKCFTNHSLGPFSSIGYFLNVMENPVETTREEDISSKLEVELGGVVQLQCPKGSIGCWGRRSNDGMWNAAGSTAPHGALSISGLLYQEAGEYRCEGISPTTQGQLQILKETTIIVTGGPTVNPSNKTVLVSEGQSATFSAEYCANPPPTRVVWISSERLIRLGENAGQIMAHKATNATAPGCNIAQLTIKTAGLQHNGEFSLLVRNAHGSKEAVFQLAVTATRKVSKTDSIFNDWLGISNANIQRASPLQTIYTLIIFTVLKRLVVRCDR